MSKTPEELKEIGFEEYIEIHFKKNGYRKGTNEDFNKTYALDTKILFEFLESTQSEKLQRLKEIYKDHYKSKILSRIHKELNKRGTIDVLRHKVKDYGIYLDLAYFKPASKLNPKTLELYQKNNLTIYRQVAYSLKNNNTIDMLICLNGLPIAVLELKNQFTGQSVENGMKQFRETRDSKELLFQYKKRAIIFFAVDTEEVHMTTKLADEKTFFLPFNKGSKGGRGNPVNPNGFKTSYLWEEVLQKDSLLDILQRFVNILKEKKLDPNGNEYNVETLIFPRYHQLEAVRKLENDTRINGPGKRYLIQHSAGSGKTLTISWLVHRLSSLHNQEDRSVFDSIIVITDRLVLDTQLQDNIYQIEHKRGVVEKIDKDSTQLAEAITTGKRIIISTIQKFSFILDKLGELQNKHYAIIIDEAHSSFSGEYMGAVKEVLAVKSLVEATQIDEQSYDPEDYMNSQIEKRHPPKNMSFYAFTATPKAKTIELFGLKDPSGETPGIAFHLYSMRQAIEEGFILDVLQNYVTYNTYFQLSKKILEDPEYNKSKAARTLARFVKLHPYNITQKTEIMMEHFQNISRYKIGGKAKAMVVTSSRLHALRYYFAFKEYIKQKNYALEILIAFSGTIKDGGIDYKETTLNEFGEKKLPKEFSTDKYQILIVAEKYQTGFNQPFLHTMYVDKKLSGLKAVQTLSRLNRTCKGKDDTFILDFVNKAEDIQDSFRPYYETTILEEYTDPNLLYEIEAQLHQYHVYIEEEIERFVHIFLKPKELRNSSDRAIINSYIDKGVERFEKLVENDQEDFKSKATRFTRIYSFILHVTYFTDIKLHKLHLYLSFLLKKLPKRMQDKDINIFDEVALEYYKNEKIFEGNLSLQPEGETEPLTPVKYVGTGKKKDEKEYLSTIIEKLNERFGTDFTEVDRLSLEQIKEDFATNKELVKKAKVNTKEDFGFAFNKAFMDIVINRMEQNQTFFRKILDDEEFKNVLMGYLLPETYEKLRNTAET